eukprot:1065683-Rhodomonas_salina.3
MASGSILPAPVLFLSAAVQTRPYASTMAARPGTRHRRDNVPGQSGESLGSESESEAAFESEESR